MVNDKFLNDLQKIESLCKGGDFQSAVPILKKLIRKRPSDARLIAYLGQVYFFKGELNNSEKYLNQALQIDRNSAPINFNLGNVYASLSRHEKAIDHYKNCIQLKLNNEHIFNNLGASYLALQDYDNAIDNFTKALEINSTFQHALLNFGQTIFQQSNADLKQIKFTKAKKIASLNKIIKMIEDGISKLELLVSLNQNSFEGHRYLALLKRQVGDIKGSENHSGEAIKINKSREDLKYLAKSLHYESEQLNKSLDIYDILIQSSSKTDGKFEFISKKIEVLLGLNKQDDALQLFKKNITNFSDLDIINVAGYFIKQITKDEIKLTKRSIENIIQHEKDKNILSKAYFEMARLYLEDGDIDQYMQNLNDSKEIRRDYIESSKEHLLTSWDLDNTQIQKRLNLIHNLKLDDLKTDLIPIFVIGMPRSGTTLIEMILSNHSNVVGCGEIGFLKEKIDLIKDSLVDDNLCQKDIKNIFATLRDQYISYVIGRKGDDAGYFVDKHPMNAEIVDVLKIMFPHAKFIFVDRDNMANAWSMYSNHFGYSIYWLNSMQGIVDRKQIVKNFVQQAETKLNIPIKYQSYQELVNYPENNIRELLEFCDLSFEDKCLHPEQNEKSVLTLSIKQARKSIYTGSDDKWKKFDKYLDVLKDGFID